MVKFDRKKLMEIRKKKGWTIADVMRKFHDEKENISHVTLINHECGETTPNAEDIALYSIVYNVPVSFFFNRG